MKSCIVVRKRARKLYLLDVDTIDYIEADGNYVNIHVSNEQYIARYSLKLLAATMLPRGFMRIERSLLPNFRRISFAERHGHGEFAFTVPFGRQLISTRTHRRAIIDALRGADMVATIPHSRRKSAGKA